MRWVGIVRSATAPAQFRMKTLEGDDAQPLEDDESGKLDKV
jgi:hypothetical protein